MKTIWTLSAVLALTGCCTLQKQLLLDRYETEQRDCLAAHEAADEAEACVERVRLIFKPLFAAYEADEAS